MKNFILFLLILTSNITLLNAEEPIKIHVKAFCSDSKDSVSKLSIKISSNILNLSEDAIQDNLGGYVDIPEDKYYLKTSNNVYRLNGVVETDYNNKVNQFTSYIDNNSKKFINIEELHSLKENNDLKFIQKINLENNEITSVKDNTTTNILNIYFDKDLFDKEYQRCKKQLNNSIFTIFSSL